MQRFRSLGYLKFDSTRLDHNGRFLHIFTLSAQTLPARFRQGDFPKLVPHGMADIQGGFPVIMAEYEMEVGEVGLLSRSGRLRCNKELFYSLEEDMDDWNLEKMDHAATALFSDEKYCHVRHLLTGNALHTQPVSSFDWVKRWLARDDQEMNPAQQQALMLPFQYQTGLIQGPPGTGKTHLLGWIIISLILEAHNAGRPLLIGVSALTHQAIDTVLKKVLLLADQYLPEIFPGQFVNVGKTGPLKPTRQPLAKKRNAPGAGLPRLWNMSRMPVILRPGPG